MKAVKIPLLLLSCLAFLVCAIPIYADMAAPDPIPTNTRYFFRNCRETGDAILIIYANIPYASLPDNPVTETFNWRLMDTDGTTELGSTIGSVYQGGGYGYNVYSMYWNAANVTALGMGPNDPYILRLSGNPVAFADPPIYDYPLVSTDYSTLTERTDVQLAIATLVIDTAYDLNNRWGLETLYSLVSETEAATVLSTFGQAVFRSAIYGLQSIAPWVFPVVIRVIDIDDREWSSEYSDNLTGQYTGTWIDTAKDAGESLFGTDYDLLSIIIVLVLAGGLLIGNMKITGDHWNALIDVAIWGVIAARLGMYQLGVIVLIAALCWIFISSKVWFRVFQ